MENEFEVKSWKDAKIGEFADPNAIGGGYSKLSNWIAESNLLTPSEKLTYTRLAGFVRNGKYACVKVSTLAKKINLSPRQVLRILCTLEKLEFITIQKRKTKNGIRLVNRYYFKRRKEAMDCMFFDADIDDDGSDIDDENPCDTGDDKPCDTGVTLKDVHGTSCTDSTKAFGDSTYHEPPSEVRQIVGFDSQKPKHPFPHKDDSLPGGKDGPKEKDMSLDEPTVVNQWIKAYATFHPTDGHPFRRMSADEISKIRVEIDAFLRDLAPRFCPEYDYARDEVHIRRGNGILEDIHKLSPAPVSIKQALYFCKRELGAKAKNIIDSDLALARERRSSSFASMDWQKKLKELEGKYGRIRSN